MASVFPEAAFSRGPEWGFSASAAPFVPLKVFEGAGLSAHIHPRSELAALRLPWQRLAARACDPNAFFAPGFLEPALRHLSRDTAFRILTIRSEADGALLLLLPLADSPFLPLWPIVSVWRNPLVPLGTPLLAADAPDETLGLALAALGTLFPHAAALRLCDLPLDGPVATRLCSAHSAIVMEHTARAVRCPGDVPLRPKLSKEIRRLERRAAERGPIRFDLAQSSGAVRDAIEHFLALEARGWKGRVGTALVQTSGRAAFARAAAAGLTESGAFSVATLTIDGRLAASGLVLRAGAHCFYWKTAFDEQLAALSPGVLLSHELGNRLIETTDATLVDSCAIANHPMIDRLWTGRRMMADLLVPLPGRSVRAFAWALRLENARRTLRRRARTMLAPLRARLTPGRATPAG